MQDTHLKKRQLDAVDLDIRIQKGHPQPYGATSQVHGVNFSVFSRHATSVTLVLFRPGELEPALQISLDPAINRTGDVWHIMVTGLEPGFEYGYRLDRADNEAPEIHRFDPGAVVFDPYARALSGPSLWQETQRRAAREGHWRGLVVDEPFDWEGQRPLNRHLADTIIYELHVRGFTKDPSAGIEAGGTFRGLIEKIPYLQELGITAVELLPVTEFDEADNYRKNPLTGERLHNYWGYHPLGWFAPKAAYANSPEAGAQVREFKELVKAFHSAGIEVILDMVFNHTGEGNEKGPTLCFRGLDNSVYYMVNEENGEYANYSGCGNTVNCNHPVVRDLIVDCLCYWVTEMHVDGFRFDLASILGRGPDGEVLANPPLLERIAAALAERIAAAEEALEDVADAAAADAALLEANLRAAAPAEALTAKALAAVEAAKLATLVVLLALLLVGEHRVGLLNFLKALFGALVVGIAVGVVFAREVAVCFLDFALAGVFVDAEDVVVIFGLRHKTALRVVNIRSAR